LSASELISFIEQLGIEASKFGGRLTDRAVTPQIITIPSLGTKDAQKVAEGFNVDLQYTFEEEARGFAFERLLPALFSDRAKENTTQISARPAVEGAFGIHFYWLLKHTQKLLRSPTDSQRPSRPS